MKIYSYFFLLFFLFFANGAHGYTREEVLQRGWLNCGVSRNIPGFAAMDESGDWTGFDTDFCRAVAVAVLGDPHKVEFVPLDVNGAYTALLSGKIDLLLLHESGSEWDFTRDSALAVNFVATSFYDEFGVMTSEPKAKNIESLTNSSVCLPAKGMWLAQGLLQQYGLRGEKKKFETQHLAANSFLGGGCGLLVLPRSLLLSYQENGHGVVLSEKLGQIAFGPVVRQGDDNWFSIVRWVLFALLDAESLGVNSTNVDEMRRGDSSNLRRFFGYEGNGGKSLGLAVDWAPQVIIQVGNYGEIFARNLGVDSPLKMARGKNNLCQQGGLHCPPPLR